MFLHEEGHPQQHPVENRQVFQWISTGVFQLFIMEQSLPERPAQVSKT